MAPQRPKELTSSRNLISGDTVTIAVTLTLAELAAISRAAFVITAGAEQRVVNAAESAVMKLRAAAANKMGPVNG